MIDRYKERAQALRRGRAMHLRELCQGLPRTTSPTGRRRLEHDKAEAVIDDIIGLLGGQRRAA